MFVPSWVGSVILVIVTPVVFFKLRDFNRNNQRRKFDLEMERRRQAADRVHQADQARQAEVNRRKAEAVMRGQSSGSSGAYSSGVSWKQLSDSMEPFPRSKRSSGRDSQPEPADAPSDREPKRDAREQFGGSSISPGDVSSLGGSAPSHSIDDQGAIREVTPFTAGPVIGRVHADGTIREDGPLSLSHEQVGHVTPEGDVYRDEGFSSEYVGRIDKEGNLRDRYGNIIEHIRKKD